MISDNWVIEKSFSDHGQIQKDSLFEKIKIDSTDFNEWVIYIPCLNITFTNNEGGIHFGLKTFNNTQTRRILYFKTFLSQLDISRQNSLLSNNEIYFESFPEYKFLNIYFLPDDNNLINNKSNLIQEAISELSNNDYFVKDSFTIAKTRAKQAVWRKEILNNYHFQCCMPECDINDSKLLVAAHIKDYNYKEDPQLAHRAHPQNGLCFCSLCHKLFDNGYFTLTLKNKIEVSKKKNITSKIINHLLSKSDGLEISNIPKKGLQPLDEFIKYHRQKWNF